LGYFKYLKKALSFGYHTAYGNLELHLVYKHKDNTIEDILFCSYLHISKFAERFIGKWFFIRIVSMIVSY